MSGRIPKTFRYNTRTTPTTAAVCGKQRKKYGIVIGTKAGEHYPKVVTELAGVLPFGVNKERKLQSIVSSLSSLRLSVRMAGIAAARGIRCSDDLKIARESYQMLFRRPQEAH